MKCEDSKTELPALLYGELSEAEREKMMAHISACSQCRKAWEELKNTEAVMLELGEEEPPAGMVFVAEEPAGFLRKLSTLLEPRGALRWGLAAAAALLALWILKPAVSYRDGDFSLSFGKQAVAPSAVPSDFEQRMQAERIETLKLVSRMMLEQEQQQRRDYTLTLAEFARGLERQRRDDMRMIGSGLENVQQNTQVGWLMTNMRMEDLIKNASYDTNETRGR